MKQEPRYSVIIPVFNAENTLRRCVDSLLNQDYTDAQIVLINDGSSDNSDAVCRAYAEKYTQVVHIAKENGGVSSARNAGLDAATGTYVTFVDSDDYVSGDYFAQLDVLLAEHPADMVLFSHSETDGGKTVQHTLQPFMSRDRTVFFPRLCEAIYKKTINSPCNKLYLRSKIRQQSLRFREDISIGEDRLFNIAYALACESICISEKQLYVVSLENDNSLSRSRRQDLQAQFRLLDRAIDQAVEQAALEPEYLRQIEAALHFDKVRAVYSDAKRMHLAGAKMLQRRKHIRERCKQINAQKRSVPDSRFCRLLSIPVRWRLVAVIDAMGWRLARGTGRMNRQ